MPTDALADVKYELCRYNIARTMTLRRDGKPGYRECSENGRYYGPRQIPTARTDADMDAMLTTHRRKVEIEVLITDDLPLPASAVVLCYCAADQDLADSILEQVGSSWRTQLVQPPGDYRRNQRHVKHVTEYSQRALADPDWRGKDYCVEFDQFRNGTG